MVISYKSSFYINEIYGNSLSQNKTIETKYGKCDVEYIESKIILNFKFYISQNFKIPSDLILLNIEMPSQQITQIMMHPSKETIDFDHDLVDKKNTMVFYSRVVIDTSDDSYFQNLFGEKNIPLKCFFSLNGKSLANNEIEVNQDLFSKFVVEVNNLSLDFSLPYQNFAVIDAPKDFNHFSEMQIDSSGKKSQPDQFIRFYLPEYDSTNFPIISLFSFVNKSNYELELSNFAISLTYSLGETKTIKSELSNHYLISPSAQFQYHLGLELYFDNNTSSYKFKKGDCGIKFNHDLNAQYELSFDAILNGKKIRYVVSKNFSWETKLLNQVLVSEEKFNENNSETIYDN